MAYIGVLLAFVYLYFGFKAAFSPHRVAEGELSSLFAQLYSGLIFGVALILACVGPFVLFGAHWPAVPVLIAIVVVSVVVIVLFYGKPATRSQGNVVV